MTQTHAEKTLNQAVERHTRLTVRVNWVIKSMH